ncbi:SDR family NAD(P)-dependent oxidoreductase [Buchnera aphidicola]|uniref:3-oxoacyl-[acyl-carrier-protein] reductase FabG n=1 Tax=Buchnera aphidicola subsp. Tuberolachnus salignus TaxID=98804 RepID=A0A160SX21_BUCTT|nr:SDR family NAD(P)-dependent oxidoreductase [Buchnera aphidicola]CUR53208.1 3-oxoacyl-[acyl-carrier-protein] reductase FabG [Buchnera aphidicola (Tuberolachnus salignus)]
MKKKYDKIALITGANRGIGKSILKKIIKKNIYVIGTSKTLLGVKKIKKLVNKSGTGILINFLNIQNTKKKLYEIIKKFNTIDILIHNSGVIQDNLLINMSEKNWNDVILINLNSCFYLTKFLIPNMIKKKWGRIIFISSVNAYQGNIGQTNYSASKAGMIGFMKSLALEVARFGITANSIAPGYIKTNMTKKILKNIKNNINQIPIKNFGTVKDISNMVLFLISKKSTYITGQTIHINGGMLML